MPGFASAPLLQFLNRVNSELDGVPRRAEAARASLASVSSAASEVDRQSSFLAAEVGQRLSLIEGELERTEGVVATRSTAMTSQVASVASTVSESTARVREEVETVQNDVKVGLDALIKIVREDAGYAGNSLLEILERLKAGQVTFEEVSRVYGEELIILRDRGKSAAASITTVRDALEILQVRDKTYELQELIQGLAEGTRTIEEALKVLRENGDEISQKLLTTIEAFRRGEVELDALRRLIDSIKSALGGREFANLAEALFRELREADG